VLWRGQGDRRVAAGAQAWAKSGKKNKKKRTTAVVQVVVLRHAVLACDPRYDKEEMHEKPAQTSCSFGKALLEQSKGVTNRSKHDMSA
jgi:hypothetical protein